MSYRSKSDDAEESVNDFHIGIENKITKNFVINAGFFTNNDKYAVNKNPDDLLGLSLQTQIIREFSEVAIGLVYQWGKLTSVTENGDDFESRVTVVRIDLATTYKL